jgi:glycine/D-amino acid oxidase-like deaminating enzyme
VSSPLRVTVVGAGAFGGWTALELAARGAAVTLVDAWGPGHARASSGGETRVIRAGYGGRVHYTALTVRALQRWREAERAWGQRVLHPTGVLWMFGGDPRFARATEEALREHDVIHERLAAEDAARRYPQIAFDGIESVIVEPDAGYLLARRACEAVVDRMRAAGGTYRLGAAPAPVPVAGGPMARLQLKDGTWLEADAWVFACGPWLGRLFPDAVGRGIAATRQEVFYFGPPAGDPRFTEIHLPAWIDIRAQQVYGIPGNAHRGFKIADDAPGPEMDPTAAERTATPERVKEARAYLAYRFPGMAGAPLVGAEVCQYEATPDAELVIDRHPHAPNVWIVGGGSGHGFKMGPAIGEQVASHVLGRSEPDRRYAISRLTQPPAGGWQEKWV